MTILLWILQVLLAAVFGSTGVLKLIKSKPVLVGEMKMGALEPYRPISIKAIGLAEVLGAVALLVAPLVGWSELVPWAALGLGSVAVGAVLAHAERSEWTRAAIPVGLLALCIVVMAGRTLLPA